MCLQAVLESLPESLLNLCYHWFIGLVSAIRWYVGGCFMVAIHWELILLLINRCLEEGAQDFLLKPVKLSDVKRLKDFLMRGEGKDSEEETRIHKRRRRDDCTSLPSPSRSPLSSSPVPACDSSSSTRPVSSPSVCSSKRAKLRIKDWYPSFHLSGNALLAHVLAQMFLFGIVHKFYFWPSIVSGGSMQGQKHIEKGGTRKY